MPKVTANSITMNYDQQGTGEPLVFMVTLRFADRLNSQIRGSELQKTLSFLERHTGASAAYQSV
jgi:hypothetical protein